jgi:hypothetical protein
VPADQRRPDKAISLTELAPTVRNSPSWISADISQPSRRRPGPVSLSLTRGHRPNSSAVCSGIVAVEEQRVPRRSPSKSPHPLWNPLVMVKTDLAGARAYRAAQDRYSYHQKAVGSTSISARVCCQRYGSPLKYRPTYRWPPYSSTTLDCTLRAITARYTAPQKISAAQTANITRKPATSVSPPPSAAPRIEPTPPADAYRPETCPR